MLSQFYDDHGTLLVGTENGLYRRDGDSLVPIGHDQETGSITQFYDDHGTLLVGTKNGLYRGDGDSLVPIGKGQETGSITRIYDDHGTLLVGTVNGLYRRDLDSLVPIGKGQETGWISRIYDDDGTLLVSTKNGLYRRDHDSLIPIGGVRHVEGEMRFYTDRGTLLVGASNGLFRLIPYALHDMQVTSETPRDVNCQLPIVFRWTVNHPCIAALSADEVYVGGIPKDWVEGIRIDRDGFGATATVSATITFPDKNDLPYQVQLTAKESDGTLVALGKPVPVRVEWGLAEFVAYYGDLVAAIFAIGHTALFLVLIIGARWSPLCWRVLTDPVWDKTGLWFYFALRQAGPVQRWILARWFDAVRAKTIRQTYLPVSLSDDGKVVAQSGDLLGQRAGWRRLWVQGNAGMGKTALVLHLQSEFFADPDLSTLEKAFARYRCVPIIVPLREYRHVAVDTGQPEDWVPNVARMAVSAFGVSFEDHGLFRAMIRSGGFLLVLDGANEVERDEEIELFARSAPATPMLVTSQLPGSNYFTNWRLPQAIEDEIAPLLRLFLGDAEGERTFARIKSSPLLSAIRSGYDVRVIADLVEGQGPDVALPPDRLGLYQLILAAIRTPSGSEFPEDRLCKAAWDMWLDGARKLEAGKNLDADLLDLLIREDQKVLRILDGQQFEFRHDQMRAYLAARWAAHHEAQPIKLFESKSAIWRISRKEQEEVWGFFAEMYASERPAEAATLWKWATTDPDRVILQHALQDVLTRTGLDPEMSRAETELLVH